MKKVHLFAIAALVWFTMSSFGCGGRDANPDTAAPAAGNGTTANVTPSEKPMTYGDAAGSGIEIDSPKPAQPAILDHPTNTPAQSEGGKKIPLFNKVPAAPINTTTGFFVRLCQAESTGNVEAQKAAVLKKITNKAAKERVRFLVINLNADGNPQKNGTPYFEAYLCPYDEPTQTDYWNGFASEEQAQRYATQIGRAYPKWTKGTPAVVERPFKGMFQ